MTTKEQSSVIAEIKNWLFPGIVTIIGLFAGMMLRDIKEDLAEVKADVKALMVQSSVDKTRIDNLERQVFKTASKSPISNAPQEPTILTHYAVLTNNDLLKKHRYERVFF